MGTITHQKNLQEVAFYSSFSFGQFSGTITFSAYDKLMAYLTIFSFYLWTISWCRICCPNEKRVFRPVPMQALNKNIMDRHIKATNSIMPELTFFAFVRH